MWRFLIFLFIIIIHGFYIALLFSALEQTHCAYWHVILNEWLYVFIVRIINIHGSGALIALFGCCKCCRFGAGSVYTIEPCTRLQCHFIQSHIGRVYVCLGVTCHLHFWQNDRDLVRATAVTRGWNGYWNKSQHRKLTLEKKILPPLLPGLEPGTFRSQVRRSNHWAIPAPQCGVSVWNGRLTESTASFIFYTVKKKKRRKSSPAFAASSVALHGLPETDHCGQRIRIQNQE